MLNSDRRLFVAAAQKSIDRKVALYRSRKAAVVAPVVRSSVTPSVNIRAELIRKGLLKESV
jgi:hypothetical protein